MAAARASSLPACPLCTEGLGTYGGPTTLPCGHNGCLHCFAYLQQRSPSCPLCRSDFSPELQLAVNYELKELLRLATALTAVEGEDGWQAVTSPARLDPASCKHVGAGAGAGDSGAAAGPAPRVDVGGVLEGAGSPMDLGPQPWEPDSAAPACRAPGCGKPFSFLLRPRHHCRCCGRLFCGACCAERALLPPKFQQAEPQRVCGACRELLLPIQPLLAGSIAPAVRQPVHDVTDWSAPRAWVNLPLSSRLEDEVYKATNIARAYVKQVGSLPAERAIPPAILHSCAGLAVLCVARVGAGWAVSAGSGLVVARRPEGGWSAPAAVLSVASSFGWQLGAEVQDVVLVLPTQASLKAFCSSQLGLGGGASVAAGPLGRAAGAKALAALGGRGVVYSYSATRGAYAGVSLEGSALTPRDAVNRAFYGRKVSARQLLISGAVPPPPAAAALYQALDAMLEHGGQAPARPQFLSQAERAASEARPELAPAASLPALPAAVAAEPEEEWEPEEAPSAPAQHGLWGWPAEPPAPQRSRQPGVGGAGAARHPWGASAPAFEEEDTPAAWGSLFD